MKITVILNSEREEEVIVYAKEKNSLVKSIEDLVNGADNYFTVQNERGIKRITEKEAYCFYIEDKKVYVLTEKENRLAIKGKNLYSFEELYPDDENQLLAEVILSNGRNIITIMVEDYFGNSKTATYTVDVI